VSRSNRNVGATPQQEIETKQPNTIKDEKGKPKTLTEQGGRGSPGMCCPGCGWSDRGERKKGDKEAVDGSKEDGKAGEKCSPIPYRGNLHRVEQFGAKNVTTASSRGGVGGDW